MEAGVTTGHLLHLSIEREIKMPSNILTTDTSFPRLTDQQSSDEKITIVTNYLYMLLEQLRYTLGNLGEENFNETELDNIANIITEPVYIQLKDAEKNVSALYVTAKSLSSRMSDAEGNVSSLTQTVNGFVVTTTDEDGNTKFVSLKNGIVTADAIAAGAVTADKIAAGAITAENITLTGSITWNDLSSGVQSTINGAYNSGGVTENQVTVITQNAIATASISANQITTGTLNASSVSLNGLMAVQYGGSITAGHIGSSYYSGLYGVVVFDTAMQHCLRVSGGGAKLASYNSTLERNHEIYTMASGCWTSDTITVASDKRLKKAIEYDMEQYEGLFMLLKPCSYYMNNDEAQRHWGFIAQDFADSIVKAGFAADKIAALSYNGEYYGIGYTELVPLNTHMIQKIIKALAEAGVTV